MGVCVASVCGASTQSQSQSLSLVWWDNINRSSSSSSSSVRVRRLISSSNWKPKCISSSDVSSESRSRSSYVWVNPDSPRASQLGKHSYHSRYTSLVNLSQTLDHSSSSDIDVSSILSCFPEPLFEQDAVIVLNHMTNPHAALSVLHFFQDNLSSSLTRHVVLYNVTLKVLRKSRSFHTAHNLFDQMLLRGVTPDNITFSTLISCARISNFPHIAVQLFEKMPAFGCVPDDVTYSAMIDAYGRAGDVDTALQLYDRARTHNWKLDAVTFSTLIRIYDEAVEIYQTMKTCGDSKPDSWTFSSMVTIYACCGRVGEAESVVDEMVEAGFEPNIFVFTSLIQCYGKANQTDDVVRTFNRVLDMGITPDDRFCCCLLNVMTQTPKEKVSKLLECIEKANAKLGNLVEMLLGEEFSQGQLKAAAFELFDTVSMDVKKPYCNCMIDVCVNFNMLERACELLEMGLTSRIYTDIQSRTPTQWSLHLKSLSLGAALTSLHVWMNDLKKAIESGEQLPPLLGINTGHGKHKYSEKGLAGAFEAHLKELNAPFHEAPDKAGWFLTTKAAAKSWLESQSPQRTTSVFENSTVC
ncbi:pentatricopeptide repeat-containing protein At4g16390, chloroplastic isoform X2 [Silene latifolia]|uniref:pentatricopeptide repeat-containing protein At4g16390, chloroplastic isoform X2 n=1 Tax=Silene latifolia TaxID=37657 RepID=UPI003D781D8D